MTVCHFLLTGFFFSFSLSFVITGSSRLSLAILSAFERVLNTQYVIVSYRIVGLT